MKSLCCRLLLFGIAVLLSAGCDQRPVQEKSVVRTARYGVFFGGQLQERDEIPFVVDSAKQTQGLRIELAKPQERALTVSWEMEMPVGRGKTVTKLGRAVMASGQLRLDRDLPFEPGDPLGIWNVRVVVDGRVEVDRAVLVFDARRRARRLEENDD